VSFSISELSRKIREMLQPPAQSADKRGGDALTDAHKTNEPLSEGLVLPHSLAADHDPAEECPAADIPVPGAPSPGASPAQLPGESGAADPGAVPELAIKAAERMGRELSLIAELRQTEISLPESEARFRAIFQQAAVGVAEVDVATGRYLAVNRHHCEILGMTEAEMLAATFPGVTHPEDRRLHVDKLTQLASGQIDNINDGETLCS
jgi:PAS domain-containing protein